MTFELNLNSVKVNHEAGYQGQESFNSRVVLRCPIIIRLSTFTHAAANKGIGNESVPKIIINDTIIFFLNCNQHFLTVSECCLIKFLPFVLCYVFLHIFYLKSTFVRHRRRQTVDTGPDSNERRQQKMPSVTKLTSNSPVVERRPSSVCCGGSRGSPGVRTPNHDQSDQCDFHESDEKVLT